MPGCTMQHAYMAGPWAALAADSRVGGNLGGAATHVHARTLLVRRRGT